MAKPPIREALAWAGAQWSRQPPRERVLAWRRRQAQLLRSRANTAPAIDSGENPSTRGQQER